MLGWPWFAAQQRSVAGRDMVKGVRGWGKWWAPAANSGGAAKLSETGGSEGIEGSIYLCVSLRKVSQYNDQRVSPPPKRVRTFIGDALGLGLIDGLAWECGWVKRHISDW